MILNGTDYGRVWNSSGARGWFGEGYWYHRALGLDYTGCTFVAKTTTLDARAGNMPLDGSWRPKEWLPRCIVVRPLSGVVLNAVGLSGPGAIALLNACKWQKIRKPFVLSFMAVGDDRNNRTYQAVWFAELLRSYRADLAPFALQVNFSCPNVAHGTLDHGARAAEILESLAILREIGVPLIPKFNALEPIETIMAIEPACDAVALSNTIPWGALPDRIDWRGLFGSDRSPLAHLGGGGLSGRPLLSIVWDRVRALRDAGWRKSIVAGGGVLSWLDAVSLLSGGADAIELGSIALLRPWRIRGIIRKLTSCPKTR